MITCLSEKAFQALLDGSVQAEQETRWKRHLRECDVCAAHFIQIKTSTKDKHNQSLKETKSWNNKNHHQLHR